jgi:uncharacterized protein (UPF0332 family)
MTLKSARKHLTLAMRQRDRASTDAWEPTDHASCVTNVFYAYENLIVATAEASKKPWRKNHYKKAELAGEFAKSGILSKDLSDEILRLNDLRKDVSYGEAGEELGNEDLYDLVDELETMIDEVESIIAKLEAAAERKEV